MIDVAWNIVSRPKLLEITRIKGIRVWQREQQLPVRCDALFEEFEIGINFIHVF